MLLRRYTDLEVRVREFARKAVEREGGASAVEYALLVALIAIVIFVAVTTLGRNLRGKFTSIASSLQ